MADLKISQLGVATNPTGGELLPIVQSGTTKKVTVTNLLGITPDGAGNVGLGVTPSAWSGAVPRALQLLGNAAINAGSALYATTNAFYNGTSWIYQNTDSASYCIQNAGAHKWFTAPSGTAGNAISFTQAMTLDANGRLLVGTTSAAGFMVEAYVAAGNNGISIQNGGNAASDYAVLDFRQSGTQRGVIYTNQNNLNVDTSGGVIALQTGGTTRATVKAQGQLRFVPLAAAPTTGVENGDVYYDSTTNKLRVRANGAWVDLH